jgi:hypothetical protein
MTTSMVFAAARSITLHTPTICGTKTSRSNRLAT